MFQIVFDENLYIIFINFVFITCVTGSVILTTLYGILQVANILYKSEGYEILGLKEHKLVRH